MFTRIFNYSCRSMVACIREIFLILAVGILGSQLLIAFNGGAPIGTEAKASNRLVDRTRALIASVELDLEPGNPAALRSVFLQVTFPGGGETRTLTVAPASTSPARYACHAQGNGAWHCPTPGLKVVDLENIVVASS